MKKLIIALALSAASTSVFAISPYYAGLDMGYSNTNYGVSQVGLNDDSTGVGFRLFGGYEFNQNFSFELGWTDFAKASGNAVSSVYENAYDSSFVGRYPINTSGLSVFGKLGVAYLKAQKSFSGGGIAYANHLRPAYGIGVDNALTSNFSVTVQWWRVQGEGTAFSGMNANTDLPSADLYSVGLTYHFN